MTQHILKIIWNERKTNAWIVLEYVLVFCILWFCCDYLYYIGKSYYEPMGFDINNTYSIQMGEKNSAGNSYAETGKMTQDEKYSYTLTLIERLKKYPGIEYVCFSLASRPYSSGSSTMRLSINSDTIQQSFRMRKVSSEFFDVFRIKLTKGKQFNWADPTIENQILISSDRNGNFGDKKISSYPATGVNKLGQKKNDNNPFVVIGNTEKLKSTFIEPYTNTVFIPINEREYNMTFSEITIRINSNAAKGFEERFIKDMKEQLNIVPYEFVKISSLKEMQKTDMDRKGITNNLKSMYVITTFLIINIFLGVIGTFWYRTESRRSEIGLRVALGSTKRKIKTFLYMETIILLFISAFIGVNICINLGQTDLLTTLGIPKANAEQLGSGIEQYFINFALTFLFLAFISILAVWYPARQSSNMQPAEVLHEE